MHHLPHRYRITVMPIEQDGLQCHGRCSIEFEHSCQDDWMRMLEAMQQRTGLAGDERTALVVATRLLSGLARDHSMDASDPFAALRPHLDQFIESLEQSTVGLPHTTVVSFPSGRRRD